MKTKLDMRLEAARLAIESGIEEGFTGMATEIYNFLVAGIELPDKEVEKDPMDYMNKLTNMVSKSCKCGELENYKPESNEKALHEEAVVN